MVASDGSEVGSDGSSRGVWREGQEAKKQSSERATGGAPPVVLRRLFVPLQREVLKGREEVVQNRPP